jgi:hypothetical protein
MQRILILNKIVHIFRWDECVGQDIRILGVKNWRSVALNGEEWRAILRKDRAHKGLSRQ